MKIKHCPNIQGYHYCDCQEDCQVRKQLLIEVMEADAKDGLYNPFNTASLREITDKWEQGEISYGKMVDLINEIAIKWHNKQQ